MKRLDSRERRIRLAYENEVDTLEEYKENKSRLKAEHEALQQTIDTYTTNTSVAISKSEARGKIENVYDVISNPDIDYQTKGTLR